MAAQVAAEASAAALEKWTGVRPIRQKQSFVVIITSARQCAPAAPAAPAASAVPASHKQFQRLATDKRFQQAAHRSKHHPGGLVFLFQWTAHHPGAFVSLCAFLETCPDGPFRGSFRLAITIQVTAEAVPSATTVGVLHRVRHWRGSSCL